MADGEEPHDGIEEVVDPDASARMMERALAVAARYRAETEKLARKTVERQLRLGEAGQSMLVAWRDEQLALAAADASAHGAASSEDTISALDAAPLSE